MSKKSVAIVSAAAVLMVAAIIAVLANLGGRAVEGVATKAEQSASAPATPWTDLSDGEKFIQALNDESIGIYESEHYMIGLAHTICDSLDQGVTVESVYGSLMSHWTAYESGYITRSSVLAFCPWIDY